MEAAVNDLRHLRYELFIGQAILLGRHHVGFHWQDIKEDTLKPESYTYEARSSNPCLYLTGAQPRRLPA